MFRKIFLGLMLGIVVAAGANAQQGQKIRAYACGAFDIRDETNGRQWGWYDVAFPSTDPACYVTQYIKTITPQGDQFPVGQVRYCYGDDGRMKMVLMFRQRFTYQEANVYVGVGKLDSFQPSIFQNQVPVETGPNYIVYDINEPNAAGLPVYIAVHAVGTLKR